LSPARSHTRATIMDIEKLFAFVREYGYALVASG
jgi:hypothetical protein